MGIAAGEFDARYPVTHGICADCVRGLSARLGLKTFQEFIDGLDAPVLLVDDDVRVLAANKQAAAALGKELPSIVGRKNGDVIECWNSKLVGGCGQTLHCSACAIRNSVAKTNRTGLPCRDVTAVPDVQAGAAVKKLSMKITTEKVGACILLRIDDMRDKPKR